MSLVTEFARYDRAGVIARAKQIYYGQPINWETALSQAWAEASAELRARFNPRSTVSAERKVANG